MTVDPLDPDTFTVADDPAALDAEVPEADAAEQRTPLVPQDDDPLSDIDLSAADPADAADQARIVGFDEEDERP